MTVKELKKWFESRPDGEYWGEDMEIGVIDRKGRFTEVESLNVTIAFIEGLGDCFVVAIEMGE